MAQLKIWDGSTWIMPKAIKIWDGSTWVEKIGRMWNGTAWVEILGILKQGLLQGSKSYYQVQTDHIELHAEREESGISARVSTVTISKKDLTNINTVKIEWSHDTNTNNHTEAHIIVSTEQMANQLTYDARYFYTGAFIQRIDTVDVSTLSGEFYIRAHANVSSTANISDFSNVKVYRIWLDDTLLWEG